MGAIAEPLKPDSRTSAGAPCGQTGPEGEKPGATPCAPKQERSARTVSRLFSERNVFILCIVIFLVHCVISLFFTPDIYRDVARCYAWYARELGRGTWHAVPISFLPPLTIFLAGSLSFLGLEAYAALKTVSLLFFALTLLPLYRLLKLLGEEKGASWGCLLFIAAPRLLRYSGMALLEPVRDFFLVSAVCLLVKGWKKGVTLTDSLLLGASLGFMSLARSEGMVFAFFLLCARCYLSKGDRTVKNFLRSVAPAVLVMFFVLLPVLVKNYGLTGYPVLDQRMNSVLAHTPVLNRLFEAREFAVENLVKSGWLRDDGEEPKPEEARSGSGKQPKKKKRRSAASASTPTERLMFLPSKMFRGGYEFYMCMAALGMIVLIVRKKWRTEHSFLLGFCVVIPLPFLFFSMATRYFTCFIPLLMVFTLTGFGFLWEYAARYRLQAVTIPLLCVLLAAQLFNPWSYMMRHEGGKSRRMAEFILANRARFNPLGHSRLILHGDSEVAYYCDEAHLVEYPQSLGPFATVTGFDVLVLESGKSDAAVCAGRKDLLEIESPEKDYALFVPARKGGR